MDKIYSKRLTMLADHLENGRLGQDDWDFAMFHTKRFFETVSGMVCKSVGCAIGECPYLFQEHWHFDSFSGEPVLKDFVTAPDANVNIPMQAAMEWFGLTEDESLHLFTPYYQSPSKFGGIHLHKTSTRQNVAYNIRAFLEIKAKEQE